MAQSGRSRGPTRALSGPWDAAPEGPFRGAIEVWENARRDEGPAQTSRPYPTPNRTGSSAVPAG